MALNNKLLYRSLFIAYGIVITLLSLRPHIDVGNVPYNDKVAHLFTYAVFTCLAYKISISTRQFRAYSLGIIIYSGLIEIAQHYTGRMMSGYDFIANIAGVALAMIALSFYQKPFDGCR